MKKWKVWIEYENGDYEEFEFENYQDALDLYNSTDETCDIERINL